MKTDKPRYSRLSDIIDLVFYIQIKPQGVTLKEISSRYNVSRSGFWLGRSKASPSVRENCRSDFAQAKKRSAKFSSCQ